MIGSGSDSRSQGVLDPQEAQQATPARKKKYTPTNYPADFETEWNKTSKVGPKYDAYQVWEKLGRPPFGDAWARWMTTPRWREGFVPHVRRFLHARWFEDEPQGGKATLRVVADPYANDHSWDYLENFGK